MIAFARPARRRRDRWRDALLWTAAIGLAAGLMRLVADRVAPVR